MVDVKRELKKLEEKVYIEEMNRNLEFAKEFLTKVAEKPDVLDSIPEGALLVPYPVPVVEKGERKGAKA
ncbi:MAG: hypothetical protein ACE5PM_07915 [Candidatus Hydrothermarchaeales archaeon]